MLATRVTLYTTKLFEDSIRRVVRAPKGLTELEKAKRADSIAQVQRRPQQAAQDAGKVGVSEPQKAEAVLSTTRAQRALFTIRRLIINIAVLVVVLQDASYTWIPESYLRCNRGRAANRGVI